MISMVPMGGKSLERIPPFVPPPRYLPRSESSKSCANFCWAASLALSLSGISAHPLLTGSSDSANGGFRKCDQPVQLARTDNENYLSPSAFAAPLG